MQALRASNRSLPMHLTRNRAAAFGLACLLAACASAPAASQSAHTATPAEQAALDVVNKRIAAYNAHDIDAFIATYAENVRIIVYPERVLGTGRERMRGIFGPQFAKGEGVIKVEGQHVLENTVVSAEDITIGARNDRNIAVYTIRDGLIAEVRLIEKPR
jgi:hypothetical protein